VLDRSTQAGASVWHVIIIAMRAGNAESIGSGEKMWRRWPDAR